MNKIAFVTDSMTHLPAEYVEKYAIHVVPNALIWSEKAYQDGVDITTPEFFERLKTSKEFPTTAAVSPYAFKEVFEKLLAGGFDVFGVFTSSTMSRTCTAAQEAKEMLGADNITVLDSNTMSMAAGWPLIRAARAAEKGAAMEECEALAREGLAHSGFLGILDSMEHMQRSGRIGLGQMYMGSLLNVKPMIEVVEGQLVPAGKVRTRRKSLAQLAETTAARVNGRSPVYLSILHGTTPEDAQTVLDMIQEDIELAETFIGKFSPNGAVHVGPGALGVQFMAGVPAV